MDYLPERLAAAYTYVFHCYFLCCTPGSTELNFAYYRNDYSDDRRTSHRIVVNITRYTVITADGTTTVP